MLSLLFNHVKILCFLSISVSVILCALLHLDFIGLKWIATAKKKFKNLRSLLIDG